MLKEGRCRWNIAFSCYSEGLATGQGSIKSLKFVDPSWLTLLGVVKIEAQVRFGSLYLVFHVFLFWR